MMRVVVTISDRGVISLPAKLRREMGLRAEDQLIAESTPEGILLRPCVTIPLEIYTEDRIQEFDMAEKELDAVLRASGRR